MVTLRATPRAAGGFGPTANVKPEVGIAGPRRAPEPSSANGHRAAGNALNGSRVPHRVRIRQSDVPHVYTDGEHLYTVNSVPGLAVYGERLVRQGDAEYRQWDPRRSKLAAFLKRGAAIFPFGRGTDVLYLGAAQGTTVSHLADICLEGMIYAVEISRRAFQKLLDLSERRQNLMPILADAGKPETYERLVAPADVMYQDVAQRDQVEIFRKNLKFLRPGGAGILMVKARSADVTAAPKAVYASVRRKLASSGLDVVQVVELEPYQRDHACVLIEKA